MDCAPGQDAQTRIAELEAQFAKERAQFALAERAAGVGYWRVALPEFRVTVSPGMYLLLGVDPAELNDTNRLLPATGTTERSFFREIIGAAVQSRSGFSVRRRIQDTAGSERVLDMLGEVELGADGEVTAVVGATHDVTERVKAEAERNKTKELYDIITEAASDIIMVHDVLGTAEFASAALGHVLGWTIRDVNGQDMADLVHPDDFARVMDLYGQAAPGKMISATYRLRHRDGHYVWFETTMSRVNDPETGSLRYIVTVLRNVSERKAQETALQEACDKAQAASLAKSRFLANMSHELRTPLNAIIGFSELMSTQAFGPIGNPRYGEYSSAVLKSGRYLLDLINDMLDMAKIEAGKFALDIEDTNLAETIEGCARVMAEAAASGGVSVNVSLPEEGLTFPADRRALKQIILNLLSNAIKFTPSGGHVNVSATGQGDIVRIEIRDDGIGIATEELPRLGKPFEQVRDDPKLAKKGTGLGLALVRALVEKHGGHLTIDSPAQKGTIVTVELPRSAARAQVAA